MDIGWKKQTEPLQIPWKICSNRRLQSKNFRKIFKDSPKIPPNRVFWGNHSLYQDIKKP